MLRIGLETVSPAPVGQGGPIRMDSRTWRLIRLGVPQGPSAGLPVALPSRRSRLGPPRDRAAAAPQVGLARERFLGALASRHTDAGSEPVISCHIVNSNGGAIPENGDVQSRGASFLRPPQTMRHGKTNRKSLRRILPGRHTRSNRPVPRKQRNHAGTNQSHVQCATPLLAGQARLKLRPKLAGGVTAT